MKLTDAQKLARSLMAHHDLISKGWSFRFAKSTVAFGRCHYTTKEISLSRALTELNDEARVKNTILHEIAHALAGFQAHHGLLWKRIAIKIGCDGKRCYSASEVNTVKRNTVHSYKYKAVCGTCGKEHYRKTLPKFGTLIACAPCCSKYNGNKFSRDYILVFKSQA